MLSVKQGRIKYHFLSLWYDSTWDWTQVSRANGEHSNTNIVNSKTEFNQLNIIDIYILWIIYSWYDNYVDAYLQSSWEDVALKMIVSSVRVRMKLIRHISLIGRAISQTS